MGLALGPDAAGVRTVPSIEDILLIETYILH